MQSQQERGLVGLQLECEGFLGLCSTSSEKAAAQRSRDDDDHGHGRHTTPRRKTSGVRHTTNNTKGRTSQ